MKVNKIIAQAEQYLNAEHRKRKSKIKYLKYVLKKLRKREKKLEKKRTEGIANNESTEKIATELAIIHAQRKKGIALLQQLENEHKQQKKEDKQEEPCEDDTETEAEANAEVEVEKDADTADTNPANNTDDTAP